MIVDRLVRHLASFVIRFRCPICGDRFTDLPPFAYPRKRYVRETIVEHGGRYTEVDAATYRKAVLEERLAVFHAGAGKAPDNRTLVPSTLWRWISTLSDLVRTLELALEMIWGRSPSSPIFRLALLVPPRKYRSEERRRRLGTVRRLLHADREHRVLFGRSIFPGAAAASGFG